MFKNGGKIYIIFFKKYCMKGIFKERNDCLVKIKVCI